jgi:hypothetical protein
MVPVKTTATAVVKLVASIFAATAPFPRPKKSMMLELGTMRETTWVPEAVYVKRLVKQDPTLEQFEALCDVTGSPVIWAAPEAVVKVGVNERANVALITLPICI